MHGINVILPPKMSSSNASLSWNPKKRRYLDKALIRAFWTIWFLRSLKNQMRFYSAWVPNFKIRSLVTALHWVSFLVSAAMVCQALVFSPAHSQLQSGSFCKFQQSSLIAGFLTVKHSLICSEEGSLIPGPFQWEPKIGILFPPLCTPNPLPHWSISEQAAALSLW